MSAEVEGCLTEPEELVPLTLPTSRQCALLLLGLVEMKEKARNKEINRLRIAEVSLRRLWWRHRIPPDLIGEVSGWLLYAGWVFFVTGEGFALIRSDATKGWLRLSSKSFQPDLPAVAKGTFDFAKLERLLAPSDRLVGDED